jgi:hypothetical protein
MAVASQVLKPDADPNRNLAAFLHLLALIVETGSRA